MTKQTVELILNYYENVYKDIQQAETIESISAIALQTETHLGICRCAKEKLAHAIPEQELIGIVGSTDSDINDHKDVLGFWATTPMGCFNSDEIKQSYKQRIDILKQILATK